MDLPPVKFHILKRKYITYLGKLALVSLAANRKPENLTNATSVLLRMSL
jgi:hypothetical protein